MPENRTVFGQRWALSPIFRCRCCQKWVKDTLNRGEQRRLVLRSEPQSPSERDQEAKARRRAQGGNAIGILLLT